MSFDTSVLKAYLQTLVDYLGQRFLSMPVLTALQIFDTRNLTPKNEIALYGNDSLEILIKKLPGFIDSEEARSEWLGLKAAILNHPTLRKTGNIAALL